MTPQGDQPQAIRKIVKGFKGGQKEQVLVGVTGSGKTFTMANVIAKLSKPTLVISHNKTLAAQLYSELKEFFPENAVEYFVSYYDYYQPEAYIPKSDTYIEKDASINSSLDKLRLKATSSVMSRDDTILVASVSCIYGLGSPEDWQNMMLQLEVGDSLEREDCIHQLLKLQYERCETDFEGGKFRVRANTIDVFPAYLDTPCRLEFKDDKLVKMTLLDQIHLKRLKTIQQFALYPAKHFVTPEEKLEKAIVSIEAELKDRLKQLTLEGKDLEAKRLESRTRYDLEMFREVGHCGGVENYSRHLAGREPGSEPYTLLDYFPKGFLTIIDESHQSIPQIRGMFNGDQSRKKVLVEHGFRLPSAMDNRPLKFPEFERRMGELLYVSATPASYETERSDQAVKQIIRPTGLLDPEVEVRKTQGQIDDIIAEVKKRVKQKERVLVTTLTKRMSEDLSRYLRDVGVKAHYLHSEFDAFERVEILRDLRLNKYDCIIGVNLLREGLDLPEVSLVIILDADKEGFLRSDVSLIQIAGRAARHVNGHVLLYADRVTDSMKRMMTTTSERRKQQQAFNEEHGITPKGIEKEIKSGIENEREAEDDEDATEGGENKDQDYLLFLKRKMERASKALEFQKAAKYRDQIRKIEQDMGADKSVLDEA